MKNQNETNDDLVLVPKVGKEEEWAKAIADAEKIGNGALGWRGQAEMMVDLDLTQMLENDSNIEFSKDREERVEQMESVLKTMYLETIMSLSDEVTPEEAKKRKVTTSVLYGK